MDRPEIQKNNIAKPFGLESCLGGLAKVMMSLSVRKPLSGDGCYFYSIGEQQFSRGGHSTFLKSLIPSILTTTYSVPRGHLAQSQALKEKREKYV